MEETVLFHEEDAILPAYFDPALTQTWLENLAREHGSSIAQLNYIFCSDEYLLNINQEYLQHDDYTDIITFPYQQGATVESDIFISLERVKENAAQFSEGDEKQELLRVIAHGLLHLIGFGDKKEEDVQKMRDAENKAIESYRHLQP
ncbi:MAG: rRNA maturation RNase YbeY [Saprospiraceae bacterium]|nr:rRNA maturation RNase YbeY [Saprospiraceae bacterium]MBK9687820.1 rRNA maturation RNase YbeY [Saprospiraceae bacterium]